MQPYYERGGITIYHGDCRDLLPQIDPGSVALVLTDPPYGIDYRTPPSPRRPKGNWAVTGDASPYDPSPILGFSRLVIFGANHFAHRLPPAAGWIVWDKRCGLMPSNDQSDAELAWTNWLGATRIVRCLWNGGGSLLAENGPARAIHPTQKPVRLFSAIVAMATARDDLVLDPYCGTGTTLRAAKNLDRRAIGVEIEERYCEIAAQRLAQDVLPLWAAD